jgi:solute:Na+ symporter, SSS family
MTVFDYVTIAVFLAGMLWLGSRFYRWIGSPDDFYVAGRELTPFMLAAAMTTANISLFSLVGVSGTAYQSGISIIWLTWTGNMALVLSGLFVIPVLRRLRIRTIPEFLEMRYNGGVRILVGVLWVFRLAFWIGIVLYAGVTAAQRLTGIQSFTFWVCVFALITVVYTTAGGMWSVVLTNNIGFFLMMASVLTILPMAMRAVGWWPGLTSQLPPGHLDFLTQAGKYNWKTVIAFILLGIQWATLDQGLLQSAFSARDARVVSKGMVLSGFMITPFSFLWIAPGLAARILYPGLPKGEMAVPTLIVHLLPAGVIGFVICGFLASGMSTIGSNLSAAATLAANDIYARFINRKATPRQILFAVRGATVLAGVLMIAITYLVPYLGGTVDAYLTIISIMDMPLFVIAIPYGLLWKRATWQGAMAAYLAGSVTGAVLRFGINMEVAHVTLISGVVAAIVCPAVSLLTTGAKPIPTPVSSEPRRSSIARKSSLAVLAAGFFLVVAGIVMTGFAAPRATAVAFTGLVLFFAGGLWCAGTLTSSAGSGQSGDARHGS